VLTTENRQQAEDRVGGKSGHIGKEAVKAAMTMLQVAADIAA
jgi:6,7-dimethyl-8-ribityllumazine synthase